MKIQKYSENLDLYIIKSHEACEGRYDLTGYDLHVIEASLIQLNTFMDFTRQWIGNYEWETFIKEFEKLNIKQ